jgi:hypothetical protein
MNSRALVFAAFIAANPLFADVPITREEAQSLKSYDLGQVEKEGPALEGKLVRLKFNYRSAEVKKDNDGSVSGTLMIWLYRGYATSTILRQGDLGITVPPEGAAWFMKIPTVEGRATTNAIARMKKGKKNGPLTAELLGREIKTDVKGPRVVW